MKKGLVTTIVVAVVALGILAGLKTIITEWLRAKKA